MNIYPDLPTEYGSDAKPIKRVVIDRAMDGTAHARMVMTANKSTIQLRHPMIDATEKATLDQFYLDNLGLAIQHVDQLDGNTRTVLMHEPVYARLPGNRWNATVDLEEV